jgi:hypothetical protein
MRFVEETGSESVAVLAFGAPATLRVLDIP